MTVKKLQKKAKLRNAEYFGLQEVLDRLYAQSAENKRFTVLMELVAADENILLAYRNISKNKGSKTAGTDGKTVRYLSKFTNTALIHYIKRRLEQYQPQPVRRVEIPKGDTGKTRPLGIPTIADRLIQQCFLQILEPICEAKFHERSNGFRPNRSAEHALAQCYAMIPSEGIISKTKEQQNMNHLSEKNSVLNRPMYLCLCPVCLGQFLDTGIYKIVRENHGQAKERCDFCNYRNGYDFIIYSKAEKKDEVADEWQ